jgi:hypothetical protein
MSRLAGVLEAFLARSRSIAGGFVLCNGEGVSLNAQCAAVWGEEAAPLESRHCSRGQNRTCRLDFDLNSAARQPQRFAFERL